MRAGERNGIAFVGNFKMPALCSHVTDLKNHETGQFALNVQVVIHRVRCGEIGARSIDGHRLEEAKVDVWIARAGRRERKLVGDALAGADVGKRISERWITADIADAGGGQ